MGTKMKSLRVGYAKKIYGVLSTSPLVVYQNISKLASRFPEIVVEPVGGVDEELPAADILIFYGLSTFLINQNKITENMVCIVCAGPLQLDSIPDLVPLDYSKRISYEYDIEHRPEWKDPIKAFRSTKIKPTKLKIKSLDQLTIIVDSTATGSEFLTAFNKLNAVCNHSARFALRNLCSMYLTERIKGKVFKERLGDMFSKNNHHEDLMKSLQKRSTINMLKVVRFCYKNSLAQAKKHIKKLEVDEFEVRFLLKMALEHFPREKKEDA